MKKNSLFLYIFFALLTSKSFASEGMWLPNLIQAYNYSDMQSKGLMISAEDLYDANKSSLNDAIVHFNGGCTGEVVSSKGLLFTNHHCGYGYISTHSTPENDYLKNGFWAKNEKEELACKGLYVDFIREIIDVTESILSSANPELTVKKLQDELKPNANYLVTIKPFNYGKKYFAFIAERFTDVRMVGAPPSAIGKFGFDTDNWVWPRHTGDFSVFRIYANSKNEAAPYSEENVPYKPIRHFPISIEGVKEGDFTMVYGFPGQTEQHLTSYAVEQKITISNPGYIKIRGLALDVINETMKESDKKRIGLAPLQSRVSNYWKKYLGENFGLIKEHAVDKKQAFEAKLQADILKNPDLANKYGQILPTLKQLYAANDVAEKAFSYYIELFYSGPTYIRNIRPIEQFIKTLDTAKTINTNDFEKYIQTMSTIATEDNGGYYAYNKKLFIHTFKAVIQDLDDRFHPAYLKDNFPNYKTNFANIVESLFDNSYFTQEKRRNKLLKANDKKKAKLIKKDGLYRLFTDIFNVYFNEIQPVLSVNNDKIDLLMQGYVSAIYETYPNEKHWYDANSTLRISYGKVEGSSPKDGMEYKAFTTAEGILEKYIPGNDEFDVPEKLITLIKNKDYGKYGNSDNTLTVCFTGSNHTTGGNSGSPVINGKGELIGINFDRSWESTMSDILFSEKLCRNITVDIRYVLFVMDKYANAGHLIEEMDIIEKVDPAKVKLESISNEIDILSKLIQQKPNQADLYFKLGKAYFDLGDLNSALTNYNQAVKLDPKPEYIKKRNFIDKAIKDINSIKD